ncbi:MAG: redoxin domain-containing protein [Phycisphaerales bacterium]|nr:redoxin domain-containing protein [Phycisphaerales bacterium]
MLALATAIFALQALPPPVDVPVRRVAACPPFSFGSPMPTPAVERWLIREPASLTDPTRTYLISFWTSAVTPARESLVLLSRLAAKFEDRGVIVVAITSEPAEAIAPLLESGPLKGRVTIPVGCDPDQSAYRQYMVPSWQKALPTAFICGGGSVQWIGNPRAAEQVITAILEGRWTPDLRKADFERDAATSQRASEFDTRLTTLLDRKEFMALLEVVAEMEKDPDPGLSREGRLLRVGMLQQAGRTADALAAANTLLKGSRDWVVHAELARTLVSPLFPKPDFTLAMMAALGATSLSKEKEARAFIALADVQARSGQLDNALRTLSRAASMALPEDQDSIDERLALWKAEAEPAR